MPKQLTGLSLLLCTSLQRQAVIKAKDLRTNGIEIEVLLMEKEGQAFDYSRFYGDIASELVRGFFECWAEK